MLDFTLQSLEFQEPDSLHNAGSIRTRRPIPHSSPIPRRTVCLTSGCQYLCKCISYKFIYIFLVKWTLFPCSFSPLRRWQSLSEIQSCVIPHKGLSCFLCTVMGFNKHHKQQKKEKVSLSVLIRARFRHTLH